MADWQQAIAQADEVIGYSQIGGKENTETLDKLIGVPFVIEGLTFRRGDINIMPKGQPAVYRDYVSVEALIKPGFTEPFKRNRVVFNDGSTGIYRQLVKYLAQKGIVEVPEDKPEQGGSNETKYDVSFSERRIAPDGTESYSSPYVPIKLICPEGLRKSDYTNEYGESETWYLA